MNSFDTRPTFSARLNSGARLTGLFSGQTAYSWEEIEWNASGLPTPMLGGRVGICTSGQPLGVSQNPVLERNNAVVPSFPYYTEVRETFLSQDNGTSAHEFTYAPPASTGGGSLSVALRSGGTSNQSGSPSSGITQLQFAQSDGFVMYNSPGSGIGYVGLRRNEFASTRLPESTGVTLPSTPTRLGSTTSGVTSGNYTVMVRVELEMNLSGSTTCPIYFAIKSQGAAGPSFDSGTTHISGVLQRLTVQNTPQFHSYTGIVTGHTSGAFVLDMWTNSGPYVLVAQGGDADPGSFLQVVQIR